jgi:Na+/H+ antiporter NhaA
LQPSDGPSESYRPSESEPAGLHLPNRVGWRDVVVIGAIASIGLVFALFFATAVFPPGTLLLELKMGALVTLVGGVFAAVAARLLRVGRFAR